MDYSKLRSLTARQIIGSLERDGFAFKRQKGSHRRYEHADGRRVTISFHRSSQTFRNGTLKSILETQAQWCESDLRRLGLLK